MISRYQLLSQRIKSELHEIERLVLRAETALIRAKDNPPDQDYFLAAAALDMHGFYAGIEKLLELIAADVDRSQPTSSHWHRDLLAQMTLDLPEVRPPVLTSETQQALAEYLEFRHVVRNVYTFNLRPKRIAELVDDLRTTFELTRRDLQRFTEFLIELSTTDGHSTHPLP
jgi:hypothetical protein